MIGAASLLDRQEVTGSTPVAVTKRPSLKRILRDVAALFRIGAVAWAAFIGLIFGAFIGLLVPIMSLFYKDLTNRYTILEAEGMKRAAESA